LRALRAIRQGVPDGGTIYVILDNLDHHRSAMVRDFCAKNAVELVFTPTYASWANPIEAHFGPLREFALNNSDHPNHLVLAKAIRDYIRWRNATPRILSCSLRSASTGRSYGARPSANGVVLVPAPPRQITAPHNPKHSRPSVERAERPVRLSPIGTPTRGDGSS
jgi:hypothetical protein